MSQKKVGLLIHDLSPEEWVKVSREYDGWDIVTDDGNIRPCVGCFSCWNRDLGRCAINTESKTYDIYAEPKGFPKWLFIQIANTNWNRTARKNGIDPKELYRQL